MNSWKKWSENIIRLWMSVSGNPCSKKTSIIRASIGSICLPKPLVPSSLIDWKLLSRNTGILFNKCYQRSFYSFKIFLYLFSIFPKIFIELIYFFSFGDILLSGYKSMQKSLFFLAIRSISCLSSVYYSVSCFSAPLTGMGFRSETLGLFFLLVEWWLDFFLFKKSLLSYRSFHL